MERDNYPKYNAALKAYLEGEATRFAVLRNDKELSQIEKKILETRYLLKKNKWSEAIELLENLVIENSPFLNAERFYVLSSAYAFSGQWQKAFFTMQESFANYFKVSDRRGLYMSSYNLSVGANRLGLSEIEKLNLRRATNFAKTDSEKALLLRAQSCLESRLGNQSLALRFIDQALEKVESLNEVDRTCLVTVASEIYFRSKKFEKSLEMIESVLHSQSSREKPRIIFNQAVIQKIVAEDLSPLRSAPNSIKNSSEYWLKWRLLQNLARGEIKELTANWEELVARFPKLYGSEFKCLSELQNLEPFMVYFLKLRSQKRPASTAINFKGQPLLEKFDVLLIETGAPLRKEELIEAIWNKAYDPNDDSRFYKLVQRYRKLTGKRLVNRNQAYLIEN